MSAKFIEFCRVGGDYRSSVNTAEILLLEKSPSDGLGCHLVLISDPLTSIQVEESLNTMQARLKLA